MPGTWIAGARVRAAQLDLPQLHGRAGRLPDAQRTHRYDTPEAGDCVVVFPRNQLDPEPQAAGQILKQGVWTPLIEVIDVNTVARLQSEALRAPTRSRRSTTRSSLRTWKQLPDRRHRRGGGLVDRESVDEQHRLEHVGDERSGAATIRRSSPGPQADRLSRRGAGSRRCPRTRRPSSRRRAPRPRWRGRRALGLDRRRRSTRRSRRSRARPGAVGRSTRRRELADPRSVQDASHRHRRPVLAAPTSTPSM